MSKYRLYGFYQPSELDHYPIKFKIERDSLHECLSHLEWHFSFKAGSYTFIIQVMEENKT